MPLQSLDFFVVGFDGGSDLALAQVPQQDGLIDGPAGQDVPEKKIFVLVTHCKYLKMSFSYGN
jgi:hypothetical protein